MAIEAKKQKVVIGRSPSIGMLVRVRSWVTDAWTAVSGGPKLQAPVDQRNKKKKKNEKSTTTTSAPVDEQLPSAAACSSGSSTSMQKQNQKAKPKAKAAAPAAGATDNSSPQQQPKKTSPAPPAASPRTPGSFGFLGTPPAAAAPTATSSSSTSSSLVQGAGSGTSSGSSATPAGAGGVDGLEKDAGATTTAPLPSTTGATDDQGRTSTRLRRVFHLNKDLPARVTKALRGASTRSLAVSFLVLDYVRRSRIVQWYARLRAPWRSVLRHWGSVTEKTRGRAVWAVQKLFAFCTNSRKIPSAGGKNAGAPLQLLASSATSGPVGKAKAKLQLSNLAAGGGTPPGSGRRQAKGAGEVDEPSAVPGGGVCERTARMEMTDSDATSLEVVAAQRHQSPRKFQQILFLIEFIFALILVRFCFWRSLALLYRLLLLAQFSIVSAGLNSLKLFVVLLHSTVTGLKLLHFTAYALFCLLKALLYVFLVRLPAQLVVQPLAVMISFALSIISLPSEGVTSAATSLQGAERWLVLPWQMSLEFVFGTVIGGFYHWGQSLVYSCFPGGQVFLLNSDSYYALLNNGKSFLTVVGLAAWAEQYTGWSMKTGRWRSVKFGEGGSGQTSGRGGGRATSAADRKKKAAMSRNKAAYWKAKGRGGGKMGKTCNLLERNCSSKEWAQYLLSESFFSTRAVNKGQAAGAGDEDGTGATATEESVKVGAATSQNHKAGDDSFFAGFADAWEEHSFFGFSADHPFGEPSEPNTHRNGNAGSSTSTSNSRTAAGEEDVHQDQQNRGDHESTTGPGGGPRAQYKNFFTGDYDEFEYVDDEEYDRREEQEEKERRRERRRREEEQRQRQLEEEQKEKERLATVFCGGVGDVVDASVEAELDERFHMRMLRDEQFYRTFYSKEKPAKKSNNSGEGRTAAGADGADEERTGKTGDGGDEGTAEDFREQYQEDEEDEPESLPDGSKQFLKGEVPYGSVLRFECAAEYRDGLLRMNQVMSCDKDGHWTPFEPLACVHEHACVFSDIRDANFASYSSTFLHAKNRPFQTLFTKTSGGAKKRVQFIEHGEWVSPTCDAPDFVRADTRKQTSAKDRSSLERMYCHQGNWEIVKDVDGFEAFLRETAEDFGGSGKYENVPDSERHRWVNLAPLGGCRRLLSCEEEKWIKYTAKEEAADRKKKKPREELFILPATVGDEKAEQGAQYPSAYAQPSYEIVGQEPMLDGEKKPDAKELQAVGALRIVQCKPGHFPAFLEDLDKLNSNTKNRAGGASASGESSRSRKDNDNLEAWWQRALTHYYWEKAQLASSAAAGAGNNFNYREDENKRLTDADQRILETLVWVAERMLDYNATAVHLQSPDDHRRFNPDIFPASNFYHPRSPALIAECVWSNEFEFPKWEIAEIPAAPEDDSEDNHVKMTLLNSLTFTHCQESLSSLINRREELQTRWLSGLLEGGETSGSTSFLATLSAVFLAPVFGSKSMFGEGFFLQLSKRRSAAELRRDGEYRKVMWERHRDSVMHHPERLYEEFMQYWSGFFKLGGTSSTKSTSSGGDENGEESGRRGGEAGGTKGKGRGGGKGNKAPASKDTKASMNKSEKMVTFGELFCISGISAQERQARGPGMVRKNFRELSKMYHADKCVELEKAAAAGADVGAGGTTSSEWEGRKPASPSDEEDQMPSIVGRLLASFVSVPLQAASTLVATLLYVDGDFGPTDQHLQNSDEEKSEINPGGQRPQEQGKAEEAAATRVAECRTKADKRFGLLVSIKERLLSSNLSPVALKKTNTGDCDLGGFKRTCDEGEQVGDVFSKAEVAQVCETLA